MVISGRSLAVLAIFVSILRVRCDVPVAFWPLQQTDDKKLDFSCDVCQMLTSATCTAMTAYKNKKGLAKKGMLDVAIMEVTNIDHLCSYSYWYDFAEKVPYYSVYTLIDECKNILEKNEEDYENMLPNNYENATRMAEVFCLPRFCTNLWKDGEYPNQRESKSEQNIRYAKEFSAWNIQSPDVQKTSTGLQYKIIKAKNEGPKPNDQSVVKVHYEGKLLNGVSFDSSYKRDKPTEFPVNGVIPGWTEGLKMMSVGDKYQFFIPPELGYGLTGAGSVIGPNEMLVFDVELIEIVEPQKKDEL